MSLHTTEEFDALEDRLEEQDVAIEKLLDAFRILLLRLIEEGRFKTVPLTDLDRISDYLRKPLKLLQSMLEEDRKNICNELWSLADANQAKNPDLYYLARCAILIYGNFKGWACAQDSPIFYCYLYLMRVIPDIQREFVEHFNRIIFNPGYSS